MTANYDIYDDYTTQIQSDEYLAYEYMSNWEEDDYHEEY